MLIVFCTALGFSQTQGWQWAKSAGSLNDDGGGSIAIDASGNIFLAGYFAAPSITFGFTTLLNKGGDDMYIVKYHSSGNVFWARSFGRSSFESANGIKIDADGNIFVTGTFSGSKIIFDTDTLLNHSIDFDDFFLVKFNTSGNVLWAKSFGGSSADYAFDINLGSDGSIVVSGAFVSPTIVFGDTTLALADSSGSFAYDMYVVKFNADGNVLWAKGAGGTQTDDGFGNCIDNNGNISVTGNFLSPTITFGNITLTNNGNWDMFVVKYDANGNVLWAKSAGGDEYDSGYHIVFTENQNIIVTGTLRSSGVTIGDTVLSTRGGDDILLVKYDANGNVLWARNEGGTYYESGHLIKESDRYILSGSFSSPTIAFGNTILTTSGGHDGYIAIFDTDFNATSALRYGGTLDDGGRVALDANGMVYVSGTFRSPTINFGNITLTNVDTINPYPTSDVFLAKHSPFTGVNEENNLTGGFSLEQNYPNPFNPTTVIGFSLLAVGNVTLKVYDVLGKEVATLLNNEAMQSGEHEIQFDASGLPSGIYFYRLNVDGKFLETKKLLLLK